ncbi:ABCB8 protein, partial [Polypterus senegalus]
MADSEMNCVAVVEELQALDKQIQKLLSRRSYAAKWTKNPHISSNFTSWLWAQARSANRQGVQQRAVTLKTSHKIGIITATTLLSISVKLKGSIAHCEMKHYNSQKNELKVQLLEKEPEFNWKVFWIFFNPQLSAFLAAVLLAFGAAILNIHIPLMLGELVNVVAQFTREHTGNYLCEVKGPALRLLGLYGIQGLMTSGYIILLSRVGERVAAEMRKSLFVSLLRQDIAFFDANKTGRMVNRLTSDVQEFKSSFKMVISQGLRSITQTAGCFVSLYLISPKLTTVMVVVVPCLVATGALIGSFLRKLSRRAQEQVARATGVADEALGNVRAVRAFAMESRETESLANISILFGQVVRGMSAGARVFEHMVLEPTIPLKGGISIPLNLLTGHIKFSNISFNYPTRPGHVVLKDFDLVLPPYKRVAIVGESGGGKSTVAALLERFYDPDNGIITLDGHDIKSLDPSWLRGNAIGFISQEPVLFGTSVMENIRFGKPDATDKEVYEAAKMANAHHFITNFPDGYNTVVGERGVTLSGGQKQRIAIARALIKNPRILILDEATSALDAESERAVQDALDRATSGRTVLIIAHRLSTIQNADIICVLSNGNIKETLPHAVRSRLYSPSPPYLSGWRFQRRARCRSNVCSAAAPSSPVPAPQPGGHVASVIHAAPRAEGTPSSARAAGKDRKLTDASLPVCQPPAPPLPVGLFLRPNRVSPLPVMDIPWSRLSAVIGGHTRHTVQSRACQGEGLLVRGHLGSPSAAATCLPAALLLPAPFELQRLFLRSPRGCRRPTGPANQHRPPLTLIRRSLPGKQNTPGPKGRLPIGRELTSQVPSNRGNVLGVASLDAMPSRAPPAMARSWELAALLQCTPARRSGNNGPPADPWRSVGFLTPRGCVHAAPAVRGWGPLLRRVVHNKFFDNRSPPWNRRSILPATPDVNGTRAQTGRHLFCTKPPHVYYTNYLQQLGHKDPSPLVTQTQSRAQTPKQSLSPGHNAFFSGRLHNSSCLVLLPPDSSPNEWRRPLLWRTRMSPRCSRQSSGHAQVWRKCRLSSRLLSGRRHKSSPQHFLVWRECWGNKSPRHWGLLAVTTGPYREGLPCP